MMTRNVPIPSGIFGNSIIHCLSLFDVFFNVFVIGLDIYSSSYKQIFLVEGILKIQIQSLKKYR